MPFYWFIAWPGTVAHESWHWLVGKLFWAEPSKISVMPEATTENSETRTLGYVRFENLNWFNCLPIGIAPMLSIPFVLYFALPVTMGWAKFLILSSVLSQALPSGQDWRIALHQPAGILLWIGLPMMYILR